MNRKDVEEVLMEYMREARSKLNSFDVFYEEFQEWNNRIEEAIENFKGGGVPAVPPTPAVSRARQRLSTIGESPGGEVQENPRSQDEKDTKRNNPKSSQVHQPGRSKRAKLSFEDDDGNENVTQEIEPHVHDSQNVSPTILRVSASKHVQDCSDHEEIEEHRSSRRGGRRGRRTKQSSIISRKQRNTGTRVTRSSARTTRNTSCETSNNLDKDSLNVSSERSSSKSADKIRSNQQGRASNNDSRTSRGRQTRNLIGRTLDNFSQDSLNVSSVISQTSISKSVPENRDVFQDDSTKCSDRKTQNSSCEEVNLSQDSLNVLPAISQPSTSEPDVQENSNESPKKRLSNDKDRKSVNSQGAPLSTSYRQLSIFLKRIDGNTYSISCSSMATEGQKGSVGNVSDVLRRKSDAAKISLQIDKIPEKRKRSRSCIEASLPSKKSLLDEDAKKEEVNVSDKVEETNNTPLKDQCRRSARLSSLKDSDTKSRDRHEVKSFAEISLPSSETINGHNNIFEDLKENGKGDDPKNAKVDLGKSNPDSDVECSEYYSLVDAGETTEEAVPQKIPIFNEAAEPKQSIRRKGEEHSHGVSEHAINTPERTVSRKGARSPALFSAYANEPVKNRVAAYEVLSTLAEEMEVPVTTKRVTRTKTRAMAAAAAAAAVAASSGVGSVPQNKIHMNNSGVKSRPSLKIMRPSWRAKKKLTAATKRLDASKENSFQLSSAKCTDKHFNYTSQFGGKILADVNGLFSPVLNTSKKTPMTGPRTIIVNNMSAGHINKSAARHGVILSGVETFIKKPVTKGAQETEIKKLEEQKKREEKEREALRRREEMLKKHAEEKKKKRDEMRLRVQEKREAQEKEKQECQLRVGKEKDEKWHVLQQEREAKQKGNVLKKKLESERKAAEAKRKLEEAEAARIAKLKLEEQQQKKEQEEAEKERLKRIAEEKEAALLREKTEQKAKEQAKAAKEKAEIQKNTVPMKPQVKLVKLDATFSSALNTTFAVPKIKTKKTLDNAYNLEDLQSGESDDEDDLPKKSARWAFKPRPFNDSRKEISLKKIVPFYFSALTNGSISAIFPRKAIKRTSSAIWNTPPSYSSLPKY